MGPERYGQPLSTDHVTDRISPSFDRYGDYHEHRKNVLFLDSVRSIEPTRRAPTIIGRHTGQTQAIAETLSIRVLSPKAGGTSLIEKPAKTFGADDVTLLHNMFNFLISAEK